MLHLVLTLTQTDIIWIISVGIILSLTGISFLIWGTISRHCINKHIGDKTNPLERRADLLFWIGSVLLSFYLPVNLLLLVLQIIPTSVKNLAIILMLVVVFIGGILEIWAGLIRMKIVRQRKL
jgi:hypothetical protein